jgi:hypothetical protein
MTRRAFFPAKSPKRTTRPVDTSGRAKSGAGEPKGIMVD